MKPSISRPRSSRAVALFASVALSACAGLGTTVAADGPSIEVAAGKAPLTMINVLVPSEGTSVERLADALREGLGEHVSTFPGFVSAAVHRSLDDSYVVVYAKWDDQAAVDGAVQRIMGGEAPAMAEAFSMSSPDFHPYEVLEVIEARDR